MKVADRDWVFDGEERALVGGLPVEEAFFTPPPNMTTLVPPVKCRCSP
ncbi:MAG: hypothetical protein R3F11_14470 [Verrucomicrobiales bacterium]